MKSELARDKRIGRRRKVNSALKSDHTEAGLDYTERQRAFIADGAKYLHLVRVVAVPAHDVAQLEFPAQLAVFSIHRQRIWSVDRLLSENFHFERLLLDLLRAK